MLISLVSEQLVSNKIAVNALQAYLQTYGYTFWCGYSNTRQLVFTKCFCSLYHYIDTASALLLLLLVCTSIMCNATAANQHHSQLTVAHCTHKHTVAQLMSVMPVLPSTMSSQ
jgi:hypothetical protein